MRGGAADFLFRVSFTFVGKEVHKTTMLQRLVHSKSVSRGSSAARCFSGSSVSKGGAFALGFSHEEEKGGVVRE